MVAGLPVTRTGRELLEAALAELNRGDVAVVHREVTTPQEAPG